MTRIPSDRTVLKGRSTLFLASVALIASTLGAALVGGGVAQASTKTTTVNITITPQGCKPSPATAPAGTIVVNVTNKNAGSVSEVELRSSDLSHILGEQENLVPGLSGGFSINLQSGTYVFNCPNASTPHWKFKVTGASTGVKWTSVPALTSAVSAYGKYVVRSATELVSSSQRFCAAINSGSITSAELTYPKARIYYERIEPVAEIWGALDTDIDGRWENPVTVKSQFVGFHRIEQLLWENHTLTGAPALCTGLIKNEEQLLTLVKSATYNPLEMAAGATDLLNEAATAKITGEEERYSNTDLPVLQANLDGANEVVVLLSPYLKQRDAALLKNLQKGYATSSDTVNAFKASPGYDGTGYVEYSTVLDAGRRQLSQAINAYAETLSKLSVKVS